ncbi:hypothetical protein BN1263380176 [Stenotrophomonas maltophilia]|nr:hypothetical protein BN1263380176 [Stenotrophomonas maltophilia]
MPNTVSRARCASVSRWSSGVVWRSTVMAVRGGAEDTRFSPGPAPLPTRPRGRVALPRQDEYNPASYASPFHNAWQSSGEPFAAMSPT